MQTRRGSPHRGLSCQKNQKEENMFTTRLKREGSSWFSDELPEGVCVEALARKIGYEKVDTYLANGKKMKIKTVVCGKHSYPLWMFKMDNGIIYISIFESIVPDMDDMLYLEIEETGLVVSDASPDLYDQSLDNLLDFIAGDAKEVDLDFYFS